MKDSLKICNFEVEIQNKNSILKDYGSLCFFYSVNWYKVWMGGKKIVIYLRCEVNLLFNLFEWSWTIPRLYRISFICCGFAKLWTCSLLLFFRQPSIPPSLLFFISPLIQMNKAHNSSAINSPTTMSSWTSQISSRRISPNKSKPFCSISIQIYRWDASSLMSSFSFPLTSE